MPCSVCFSADYRPATTGHLPIQVLCTCDVLYVFPVRVGIPPSFSPKHPCASGSDCTDPHLNPSLLARVGKTIDLDIVRPEASLVGGYNSWPAYTVLVGSWYQVYEVIHSSWWRAQRIIRENGNYESLRSYPSRTHTHTHTEVFCVSWPFCFLANE